VVECAEDGKEHGVQRPVYHLSEVLSPTKQRYPHYQKLAYTFYMIGKKLSHYYECHSIIVVAARFALGNYSRALGDYITEIVSDQVIGPARFHSRMDQSADA
jgi:hypothetical protein